MESTLIKCVIAGMAAILARWARRAALLVQIDPARGSGWSGLQLRGGLMFSNLRLQPDPARTDDRYSRAVASANTETFIETSWPAPASSSVAMSFPSVWSWIPLGGTGGRGRQPGWPICLSCNRHMKW